MTNLYAEIVVGLAYTFLALPGLDLKLTLLLVAGSPRYFFIQLGLSHYVV